MVEEEVCAPDAAALCDLRMADHGASVCVEDSPAERERAARRIAFRAAFDEGQRMSKELRARMRPQNRMRPRFDDPPWGRRS